jgi:hypothetical protein
MVGFDHLSQTSHHRARRFLIHQVRVPEGRLDSLARAYVECVERAKVDATDHGSRFVLSTVYEVPFGNAKARAP